MGNLCEKVKKEDLEGEFTKYGKLNSVWLAFNPPGFAFVEFESRDDAEKACDVLNGTEILGSKLRVEISKGRPKGRDGGNRFGGRGRVGQGGAGSGGFRNGRSGGPGGFRSGGPLRFNGGGSGAGRTPYSGNRRDNFGGKDGAGPRDFNSGGGSFGRSAGAGGNRYRSGSPNAKNRF